MRIAQVRIRGSARALLYCIAVFGAATAGATTYAGNPANYRSLLDNLGPGDVLELAAGTYTEDLPLSDMNGTAAAPIIIRGPADHSAVFRSRSCCNTIQFDRSSYIEVHNLTVDGHGLPEPFGVESGDWSHHITIDNNIFLGFGADQQMCAISTKGPAWNWIIRRNLIEGAGTGIYLGNSTGSAAFVAGLIEYNVVLDTLGYSMEIKHQNPRPTNIGMPTGQSRTIIRHNVFSKLNNASGGSLARPNLLVGHFPLSGAGMNDIYEIYGNFLYANPTEALFQGEGNIVLHDNVLVNPSGDGMIVMPHNDVPRLVEIFNNTVVARDRGIRVTGAAGGYVQRVVGNVSFAGTPLSGPNSANNTTGSYADAATYLVAPLAAIGQLNVYPKVNMLRDAINIAVFSAYTDYDRDFNGIARTGAYRGAHEGEGTNPGWMLALAGKTLAGGAPAPAPTVSLTSTPSATNIESGTMLTLEWQSTGATSCTASGPWTGARAVSGSETVGPVTAAGSFVLACTGEGGTASGFLAVTLAQAAGDPGSGGGMLGVASLLGLLALLGLKTAAQFAAQA